MRRDADPSEERALLGSRDYAEAQERGATDEADGRPVSGGGGREGTLHRAARGGVAALKQAVLRLPRPNGGVQ